jgi:hypothetical protein
MDRWKMIHILEKLYYQAYPGRNKVCLQKDCHEFWKQIKNTKNFSESFEKKTCDLKLLVEQRERKFRNFFSMQSPLQKKEKTNVTKTSVEKIDKVSEETENNEVVVTNKSTSKPLASKVCPKQEKIKNELLLINADLTGLLLRDSAGLISDDQAKDLKKKIKEKKNLEKQFIKVKEAQQRQRKFRQNRKKKMEKIIEENPEIKKELCLRKHVGNPLLEEDQPLLLKSIVDIAEYGSGAQNKRRFEIIRSIKSLDEMKVELEYLGFTLSRTALYYRFYPKHARGIDGKRHVNTVPVQLAKPSKTLHHDHIDTKFAASSINALYEIGSLLGNLNYKFL